MIGKKILITGVNGMLGTNLIKYLSFENIIGFGKELDISNSTVVSKILANENPDIIIHTAAYTNVDECEINPDKAYLINSIGTQNLVNYCINKNILFIYISSTGIYGNEKNFEYSEYDIVKPTTVHHKSKYEGELNVKNHLNKYLILRTGWLYGGDISHSKNFVYKRYLEAKNNSVIYSNNTQVGNPTYALDFVKQIEKLIINNQMGIFNCVNRASNISRYDYVQKIIELFELDCTVKIAPEGMFNRIAPVSHNESAINYKLDLMNLNVMNSWVSSLEHYIKLLKKEMHA